ncbi:MULTISPECIES: DUF4864 domain-containing protein [unclassified Ensifer]|uniref:DUF4864 domain-containing protein n=1 Tax=unclassified Ensifer TaxID=2633371 RepID=UPI000813386A|nr:MULTISPECIES: DUF4864 domain-containing protein [unclassified Ensifer]OCP00797.1 DUF4864 domain-containing protein [Ensifer sp. LC13]OCP00840.1 DUF4864 domain-containing protein [Ensifer sp. LC11]OCP04489.1 DUF4864 domain-containing protein [Ensifer sp. LC14]OCP32355.1 DUF4864 domain-containing protein [Ensifer sp. LC499]
MFRIFAITLALTTQLVAGNAVRADEPVDTARSIIQEQIAAFLHDDAETAYSFASPAIRGKFPDKTAFFDMVKRGYQPVYRPGNFAFGRSKVVGDQVLQEVLISAPDGKDWTAIYELLKQPDGSYKINGVMMLQQAPGPAI